MALKLEIVTPAGRLLEREASAVYLPTEMGEIGVLPGHIPLTTLIDAGELRLNDGAEEDAYVIGRGFALIENDRVSVLTDHAIDEDAIDTDAVEEARRRAEEALAKKDSLDPAEVERLESVVRFSVAQIAAAAKKRR
ncbi:MAG: ATP synthase F1 subunit epsilon [Verrucomicrobia bacterium]|nr:MAG: ATP synthase F1 subunit epsilon [Verrucomicrobiota bacterium]